MLAGDYWIIYPPLRLWIGIANPPKRKEYGMVTIDHKTSAAVQFQVVSFPRKSPDTEHFPEACRTPLSGERTLMKMSMSYAHLRLCKYRLCENLPKLYGNVLRERRLH